MPSSSIFLLFSTIYPWANGMPWPEPVQTSVYQPDEWSPRPTDTPASPARIFKRDSLPVDICGWIGGVSSNSAVCPSGSSCVHDTIHAFVGCCATSGPCTAGVYTACVDKNSPGWSAATGDQPNGVYTCAGTSLCYRNTFAGDYYQYGCGSTNWAANVETSFKGQATNLFLQVVYTGVNFDTVTATPLVASSSSSSSTSSSSSSVSQTSSSATTSSPSQTPGGAALAQSPSPTVAATASTGKTSTSTGVVAGATVGSIAGLAGLAALILFCFRRRKRQPQSRVAFWKIHPHLEKDQGPFQQIPRSAPEEYISPMSGAASPPSATSVPMSAHANPLNLGDIPYDSLFPAPYSPPSDSGRTNTTTDTYRNYSPPPQHDEVPLVEAPFGEPSAQFGERSAPYSGERSAPSQYSEALQRSEAGQYVKRDPFADPPPFSDHPVFEESSQEAPFLDVPIVSSVDNFSRDWNDTVGSYDPQSATRDTHIHTGELPDEPVATTGMAIAAIPMGRGNTRTQDVAARSEALRRRSEHAEVERWSPQRSMEEPSPVKDQLRESMVAMKNWASTHAAGEVNRGSVGKRDSTEKRESIWNTASVRGIGLGNRDTTTSLPRYQLVDEMPSESIPIMRAPREVHVKGPKRTRKESNAKENP
ncbi:hypothetical protein B7494_g124 [Chlorociboria aeruginascens]|nr:hypothetical protein B7494_g124 [Chlorociboria aeruginascens]